MKVTLDTGTTYDLSNENRHKNLKININKLKATANNNQQHRNRLISVCNQVKAYKNYQGDDTAQKNAREIYNLVSKFDEGDKTPAEKKEAKPIPAPTKSVGKTPIIKKAGTKILAPEANEISDKKENVDAAPLPNQPKTADPKMPLTALTFFGSTYKKHLSQRTYNKDKFDIATKTEKLKKYLDKPVTEKKKIGEDNFSESAAWLLFDLENYKSPANLLPQYVALTCGLFMHNSSHYPMQGFGKAQELEIDYKLQYFRSEANHPRRIFFDDLMDETYKGKKSYLPRNTPFTKMLAKASLNRSFENKFKKLDEAGFATSNDDVPNFGPIIGYTGARANNLWAYIYAIDRKCKSIDNESYINNIKDLIKNLFASSLPNKLKKIAPNDITNPINYLIKYYQNKRSNKPQAPAIENLFSESLAIRTNRAKNIQEALSRRKLKNIKIIENKHATCIEFRLYPDYEGKLLGTQNFQGLTNAMIGFLGGLINHYAQQRQLFVNIQRRQSFGFLRPTLADTESLCIRVSLGLETDDFDSILIDSLAKLDELLGTFDFIKDEHETVKSCNKPCEKSKSKTGKLSKKTGNFLCKSMRSPENKWQALFDAQNILNKHSVSDKGDYVSSAFDEYLKTVIIDKANKKAADIKSTGYKVDLGNITTKKKDPTPLANQPIVFKVLKNLVDFSVEYIANIELLNDKNILDKLKHCYWHNLLKLHSNLEKAQLVLNNLDNYEITHLSAKATLLIENIQEYLILLDGLQHLHAQSNGRIYSPTSELKDTQRNYVASQLNIKQEQIEVYYTDSGQQANVASILAMDIQTNPGNGSGKCLTDGTVYVFDNSYYELAEFFKNVDSIRSEDKNTAKIAFIDIRHIDCLKTTDFLALEAVIIDITHNSSLTVAELNTLAKELLAKNKWVVFTSSTLKHEEIGLDKYQSGRMIVMSPAGVKLNPDIAGELNDISDHAMHPLIASYLKMANSVYQSSCPNQAKNINAPISNPVVDNTALPNSTSATSHPNNPLTQPLQGILPDETKLSFIRIANNGLDKKGRHGSCGFIALNTSREEVLTSIKAHLNNEQVRSYISAEIDNDYQADLANLHLNADNMEKLKLYKRTLAQAEIQRIQLINKLKAHTNLQEANEDDLINFFTASNLTRKSTYIRQLRLLKTKVNTAKTKLNTFLASDGLINDYLDRNIPNEWIGANIALAWAKASNITLRIWAHKNQANGSSEIYLRQSVQSNANPIIDILHTWNGTHYERLRKHEPEVANVQIPQVKADQAPILSPKLTPQGMNKENNLQNIKIPKIYSQKNKATLWQSQEISTKRHIGDHPKTSKGTKLTR